MGFFDTYVDEGGGNWVGSAEKRELIADATPLPVVKVSERDSQYGPEFVLTTTIDGEQRDMSFTKGSVQSRDRMFEALLDYLADPNAEPVTLVLKKIKQSQVLVNADEA